MEEYKNKLTTIPAWFYILILSILGIIFLTSIILMTITETKCNKVCDKKGALAYERYSSGNWKVDDYCMCIFRDRIETIRLGEEICGGNEKSGLK